MVAPFVVFKPQSVLICLEQYTNYVDGEPDGSSSISAPGAAYTGNAQIAAWGTQGYFPGQIEEIIVWRALLTDAEVNSVYTEGITRR